MTARCRTCNAEILWARNASRDRWLPLDAERSSEGNVTLDEGVARIRVGADRTEELRRRGVLYNLHRLGCR